MKKNALQMICKCYLWICFHASFQNFGAAR